MPSAARTGRPMIRRSEFAPCALRLVGPTNRPSRSTKPYFLDIIKLPASIATSVRPPAVQPTLETRSGTIALRSFRARQRLLDYCGLHVFVASSHRSVALQSAGPVGAGVDCA